MNIPSEIIDDALGSLVVVEETAYYSEIPWSRNIEIGIFIHVTPENYESRIQNAKRMLPILQNFEQTLLDTGINHLLNSKVIDDSFDWNEMFLHNSSETSIEFNKDGSGQFVYLVMIAGSMIIKFDKDGNFKDVQAMNG
ncbi:hypothetical protein G3480_24960 [Thiorhodococcus mannitoliphagus]|uniref:Uncharacterized protein n=1 Tax=Thiorhodococcus mannitoliphagus TaxID=329406 RepID=A0A6P1E7K5_9GAMM|nr:hypothetical protein [Thiorhodococcus mannitoliphagus]NEX23495.1 hypothetical protein [Thiorhodococcus mannitoliphagus]